MEHDVHLPGMMIRWADELQGRGLGDLALILVKLLQIWGFVGSQVLWMLSPFLGEAAVTPVAKALETPAAMEQLREYLTHGLNEGE